MNYRISIEIDKVCYWIDEEGHLWEDDEILVSLPVLGLALRYEIDVSLYVIYILGQDGQEYQVLGREDVEVTDFKVGEHIHLYQE